MSGPMGVMSTKIAFAATALLLPARVDLHDVRATLDPSAPVTRITRDLARRMKVAADLAQPVTLPRGHVVGLDHAEIRLGRVAIAPGQGDQLTIGADTLREMILELDFRRGQLRVIERGALHHRTERMTKIAARLTADGCMSLAGIGANGGTVDLTIDGSSAADVGKPVAVRLGDARFTAARPEASDRRCAANDLVLGWQAFANRVIILDLGSGAAWLSAE